ncbi:MAG: CsbD family protein [Deltaproteobacteria bacterium]|nr:CsbD family protein [Deltaproteobacteria bacterium]
MEGGLKEATGTIKEQAARAVGDRHLETEGKAEKTEGRICSGVGKAMDAVREVVNEEK